MHFSTLLTTTAVLAAGVATAHREHPPQHNPFWRYPPNSETPGTVPTREPLLHQHAASKEPHLLHHHGKGRQTRRPRARQEAATTSTSAEPTLTRDPLLLMKKVGTIEKKKISMNRASATAPAEVEPTLAPIFVPGPFPMPAGGDTETSGSDTEPSDDEAKTVTVTVTMTKTKSWKDFLGPMAVDAVFTPNLDKKDLPETPSTTSANTGRQLVVPSIGLDGIASILASVYATETPKPLLERAEPKVPQSIVTIGSHTINLAGVWSMIHASIDATATPKPLLERAEPKVPHSIVTIGSHTIDLAGVWSMIHPVSATKTVGLEAAVRTSVAPATSTGEYSATEWSSDSSTDDRTDSSNDH